MIFRKCAMGLASLALNPHLPYGSIFSGKKSVPVAGGKKYLGAAGGWAVRNAQAYDKR